jgi:hypothetical protein
MPDHVLPQTGWTTDLPWAAAFHMEPKNFRSLLKRYRIPHVPLGQTVLIDASVFYQHISQFMIQTDNDEGNNDDDPKPKRKPKPKVR